MKITGIMLTRNSIDGRCEVFVETKETGWVPVIEQSGEIISHIVEGHHIETLIEQAKS